MTGSQIRQSFLDFFKSKQHTIVPSSSLLPDSPNLLFTNAGMNQFVPIFLGQARCPYTPGRAADTQKCIRAGGKHNDLEDVGLDTYHHTFFEMLGNWSFGDYFKKEAIEWAWELVVERWKFPPARLYATVYAPDKSKNDPSEFDQEAWDHWAEKFRSVGLDPKIQIVNGGKKDNFWMMGETGPCGPCSELHVDLTPAGDTQGKLVNAGSPQCIEIWNLVFIQFNANPDGSFSPLPARHVDTGMGFERVTSIIQGTNGLKDFAGAKISNYETDIFRPIFDAIEKLSGKKYGSTLPGEHTRPRVLPDAPSRPALGTSETNAIEKPSGKECGSTLSGEHTRPRVLPDAPSRPALGTSETNAIEKPSGKECGSTLSGEHTRPRVLPDAPSRPALGTSETNYSRRNLPHFERPWAKYTVTFSTRERRQLAPPERDLVLKSVLYAHEHRQYQLYAACVMPDHVHLLFEPQIKEQGKDGNPVFWSLSEILQGIKSSSAHSINQASGENGPVWEKESMDRMIRGQSDLEEKFHYICRNPWDARMVQPTENYRWVWTPSPEDGPRAKDAVGGAPTATREGACAPQQSEQIQIDIAFRVIADHIRTLGFAIADGIQPGNTDRNYVLRRILRRAVRYGRTLGFKEPFFYKLVDVLADTMGDVFPEIRARKKHVQEVIRTEEEAFNKTLDRGIELFNEEVGRMLDGTGTQMKKQINGQFAFQLYDTYGFPLDLTELMARERGLTVDTAGFEKLMDEQKARARAAQKKEVISLSQIETTTPTRFVGYENLVVQARVLEVVSLKDKTAVILDTSACYAEMGGQVGDTGELSGGGNLWPITNTQKSGNTWLHFISDAGTAQGDVNRKSQIVNASDFPAVGAGVTLTVEKARRNAIERHHTVTHLLHWALHEVVSKEASQKGSFVGPDKLTFDFNSAPLTPQQVADVERLVNERIVENAGVSWIEVPYAGVKSRKDVMQFFGDKYGDTVRVVQIGGHAAKLDGYSMELCGGTHTRATGEIGLFRIVGENAIAAGVRRIEAVAGLEAYRKAADEVSLIKSLAGRVNSPIHELDKKIESLLAHQKELEKQIEAAQQREASNAASLLLKEAKVVNGIPVIIHNLGAADGDFLQAIADSLKGRFKGVVILGGIAGDAVVLLATVSPDFIKNVQAGKIIQQIAPMVGGRGGGKPDNARGGGKDAAKLSEALAKAKELLGG